MHLAGQRGALLDARKVVLGDQLVFACIGRRLHSLCPLGFCPGQFLRGAHILRPEHRREEDETGHEQDQHHLLRIPGA